MNRNAIPPKTSFRDYFAKVFKNAGFNVQTRTLVEDIDPVILVENPYYIIVFQVFDIWADLINAAGRMELAVSEVIGEHKGTPKAWDAYLILVCRSELRGAEEFNQLSDLTYNTRYTRKIIRVGLGDLVTRLDEVAKPFLSLTRARSSAKGRDPLQALETKMTMANLDEVEVRKLITVFKEKGDLTNV